MIVMKKMMMMIKRMIKKKDNGGGDYNGITRGLPNTSYSILLVYVMNHIAYYWFM